VIKRLPYRWQLTLLVIVFGLFFALLGKLTRQPLWAVLLVLLCLLSPPLLITFGWIELPNAVRWLRRRSISVRSVVALALVVLSFVTMYALGVNPREYAYAPLLVPVIVTAFLFGFGPGLFAVMLASAGADFYYAPPLYEFAITEWEDAIGLALFASLGTLMALMLREP
jgi:hypothetical protein